MFSKPRILLVEPREAWAGILLDSFINSEVDLSLVTRYDAMRTALSTDPIDLAIVDLWLDESLSEGDADRNGTHDGLEAIMHLAEHHSNVGLIVVSEEGERENLLNTPGMPHDTLLIERPRFSPELLRKLALGLLADRDDTPAGARRIGSTGLVRLEQTPPPVGSRPGRPRVLIVEDQPFWLNILSRLMEEAGYFWRVATTYEQATGRLRLESFHAVLLNLTAGEPTTGRSWQLLDYLTRNCPRTKLVIISGHLTSADVARLFLGYPVKGYIDKNTFDKDELLRLIEQQVAGPTLRFQTLGDFRVWRDGRLITYFGPPEAETVLKVLITRRGAAISADELVQYIWVNGDKPAYARLAEAINSVRMALEPDLPRPADSRLILRDGANYRFEITPNVEVDADQFQQLFEEGRQAEERNQLTAAQRAYEQMRELYRGDYLNADRASAWTMKERTALQKLYSESLSRLADLYAGQNRLDLAITAINHALEVDSYSEGIYRRLMRYHACRGDKNAALAVYRRLVKLFHELFSEEISPVTQQVYEDIEAGRPVNCVEGRRPSGEWRILAERQSG